jgi:hypothetical protein
MIASGLMLVVAAQDSASAQWPRSSSPYPPKYCLRTYDGQLECAYLDREQCQIAARGTGGDCAINSRFVGYPDPRAPRWKPVYR